MNDQHVVPRNDWIQHDLDRDCICGPDVELIESDDRVVRELIIHHSIDGRERYE